MVNRWVLEVVHIYRMSVYADISAGILVMDATKTGGRRVKMTRLFVTFLLLLVAIRAEAASKCDSPGVRLIANQTSDRVVTVRSGKRCGWNFRSVGPMLKNELVRRPAHGTVTVSGVGRVTYRSVQGYTGPDSFAFQRSGLDPRNNPRTFTVTVAVTVIP